MLAMVQDSIRILQDHGYKLTKPRRQVLEVLDEAEKPLSAYDVHRLLLQQGKHLNRVTIYRILDLLCRLNLAHRVLSGSGFVKCNLGAVDGCHRFMVCRCCGAIQEFVDRELCAEESRFAQNLGFHTEHHLSESSGLCADCYRVSKE